MDLKVIGTLIKKYRLQMHLTQKQLGEMIGKTESSIQKYESNSTEIPMSVLGNIAEALGVDIIDFLDARSVISIMNSRDRAFEKYLNTLGFEITSSNENPDFMWDISYNGYRYTIPSDKVFLAIEDLKSDVQAKMEKLLMGYSETKIRI